MAIRKQLSHDSRTRERIKTSQLVNRLEANAFGEIDLTTGQLKSIEILLKKTLPDLTAIELTGKDGGAIQLEERTREDAEFVARTVAGLVGRARAPSMDGSTQH